MGIQNFMRTMSCFARGIVFFIAVLVGSCHVAYAHPPTGIEFEYDQEKSMVKVSVMHISKSPKRHFIRKVELYKGDVKIDENFLAWQKSSGIDVDFMVRVEEGDVLKAKAICNKGGLKAEEWIVSFGHNDEMIDGK